MYSSRHYSIRIYKCILLLPNSSLNIADYLFSNPTWTKFSINQFADLTVVVVHIQIRTIQFRFYAHSEKAFVPSVLILCLLIHMHTAFDILYGGCYTTPVHFGDVDISVFRMP